MKRRLRKYPPPKYTPLDKNRAYRYYKMMWEAGHPEATYEEHTAAMQRLAKQAGV